MNNRGVLVKLLLLVSISLTSFCILGLFGIFNSKQIYASVDQVQSTAEEFQRFALHITGPLSELRQLTLTMVMAPDHEMQLQLDKQQRALTRQLDETFQGWQSSKTSPGEKEAFDALRASWEDYKKIKPLPSQRFWAPTAKKRSLTQSQPRTISSSGSMIR